MFGRRITLYLHNYLICEIAALNIMFQEWNKSWKTMINFSIFNKQKQYIPNEERGIHTHMISVKKKEE